jgi:peroxiredoxin
MSSDRGRGATVLSGILVSLLATACGGGSGPIVATPTRSDLGPAPGYEARRMASTAQFRLRDQAGSALLLTSFAPWCTACRGELPQMQKLHERHRSDGLAIVGVSVDDGGEEASTDFARRLGVTFDLVHDQDHNYQAAFRTLGVPSPVLVDRAGRLLRVWQGGVDVTSTDTESLIQRALRR